MALALYATGSTILSGVGDYWPNALQAVWIGLRLIFVILLTTMTIGRLHDHDRSGWWAPIYVAPLGLFALLAGSEIRSGPTVWLIAKILALLAAIIFVWHLAFLRGTVGPNRFGDDPADRGHQDDYFTARRLNTLATPVGMAPLVAVGRLWVGLLWLAGRLGLTGLATWMRLIEENHERGMQRNLVLAERLGWEQVTQKHGRKISDVEIASPTFLSVLRDVFI